MGTQIASLKAGQAVELLDEERLVAQDGAGQGGCWHVLTGRKRGGETWEGPNNVRETLGG